MTGVGVRAMEEVDVYKTPSAIYDRVFKSCGLQCVVLALVVGGSGTHWIGSGGTSDLMTRGVYDSPYSRTFPARISRAMLSLQFLFYPMITVLPILSLVNPSMACTLQV